LHIRGEPGQPHDPAKGYVWQAIIHQIDGPGSASEWISVADISRDRFAKHPWSLSGGGALELRNAIENRQARTLSDTASSIGYGAISGEDDAFILPDLAAARRLHADAISRLVSGEAVRDHQISSVLVTAWPYDDEFQRCEPRAISGTLEFLWPYRRSLEIRRRFGIPVERIKELKWYDYRELYSSKLRQRSPSVAFAEIATHNHFCINRHFAVFNQTAPLIIFPDSFDADHSAALLGVLNSSLACFWLKEVCHVKGGSGIGRGVQDEAWEERYSFNVGRVKNFPLPAVIPINFGPELTRLAQRAMALDAVTLRAEAVPIRGRLDAARMEYESIRGRMIAFQEELDWSVYQCYQLLDDAEAKELIADPAEVPELKFGERAFEILLARRMAAGEIETQWFERHRSTPINHFPAHWPESYKTVVGKRIETIANRWDISLIERPECKRRWQSDPWEVKERAALTSWLLDRCDVRELWYVPDDWGREQPRPVTVNRLADWMRADADMVAVSRLLSGPDADLVDVLTRIIADQHIPYLAQLRYTSTGMRTRIQWEKAWAL
jgi:hypothetical protein